MKRCAPFVVFASVLAMAHAAPAPEAITIKFRWTNEGDCNLVEKQETFTMKSRFVDTDGKVLGETTMTEITTIEFKETLLKRVENKRLLKIEREYARAEIKKGDKTKDLGLKGKTVVIEWKDNKYTYTFKGGEEVTGSAAGLLAGEFADKTDDNAAERALLPKSAVRTGEEWKLDVKPIVPSVTVNGMMEAEETKAAGTGKLLKAYRKDGKQFGEIHYQMVIPLNYIKKDLKILEPFNAVIDMTMELCIDGTSETGTIKAKREITGIVAMPEGQGGTRTVTYTTEQRLSQKEAKK